MILTNLTNFQILSLSSSGAFGIGYNSTNVTPYPVVGDILQIDGTNATDGFTIANHYSGKHYKVSQVISGGYPNYPNIWGKWYNDTGNYMILTNLDGSSISTNFIAPDQTLTYVQDPSGGNIWSNQHQYPYGVQSGEANYVEPDLNGYVGLCDSSFSFKLVQPDPPIPLGPIVTVTGKIIVISTWESNMQLLEEYVHKGKF